MDYWVMISICIILFTAIFLYIDAWFSVKLIQFESGGRNV